MATPSTPQYDEALVAVFEDQFLPLADTVYRFGLALTLSLDGASLCVKQSFKAIAAKLPQLAKAGDMNPQVLLVEACWAAFKDNKERSFNSGQSAVTKALKPLSIEARAALTAVDVAGLAPADAARALAWSEPQLRVYLAEARRSLLRSGVQL